jgi:hypothetical protein
LGRWGSRSTLCLRSKALDLADLPRLDARWWQIRRLAMTLIQKISRRFLAGDPVAIGAIG